MTNTNLQNLIQDVITSYDPYASSIEEGDQLVRNLVNIALAARSYSDDAIQAIGSTVMSDNGGTR